MKGTQTVFDRHRLLWRLRGVVQGNAEPDFDVPSLHADFVYDQSKEFLALVEVQSVDGGRDLTGPAQRFRQYHRWRVTATDHAKRTAPRSPGTAPKRCATRSHARSRRARPHVPSAGRG